MKSKGAFKNNREKKKHDLKKCTIFNETHQFLNKTGNNVNQNYRKTKD